MASSKKVAVAASSKLESLQDLQDVEQASNTRRRIFYTLLITVTGMVVAVFLLSGTSLSNLREQSASTTTSMTSSVSNMNMISKSARTSSKATTTATTTERVYYASLKGSEKKSLFDDFISKYGKSYADDTEKDTRYANFKKFLELIDERNDNEAKARNTAVHGVTQFADLSEEEISKYLLGYKKPSTEGRRQLNFKASKAKVDKYKGTATAVDWSSTYATSVSDQGYCGSCWAYSTAEQMESDAIRAGYLTTDDKLSVQQMVSCDTVDLGCLGGNTETAYEYVNGAGGLMLEADYPYTSYFDVSGKCSVSSSKYVLTVDKYYTVDNEDDMIDYVLSNGPLSICAAASSWTSYQSGIVSSCDNEVDHCIQITGVDTDDNYWIIRNSWGKSWGNDGYIYIKTGEDMCAISNDPTYTKVSLVSR